MIQDTIVAIATAIGESGISIIRISGNKSLDILKEIFKPAKDTDIKNKYMHYGHIVDNTVIDEVMCVFMKAPHTYTTEDVVEIHTHGGTIPVKRVLNLILRKGARTAKPGEFTYRAFIGGRIELNKAEAIIDIIQSKTELTHNVALSHLEGKLNEKLSDIRDEIAEILALITINIDYPDDDHPDLAYNDILNRINNVTPKIDELVKSYNTGRILSEGYNVAIVGKPNAGKSSLLNALIDEERAIVTDIAGTTRDTIKESISIEGIPINLIDTAGIRESSDVVESIGINSSKNWIKKADVVILILDNSEKISKEDIDILNLTKSKDRIVLINKSDLETKLDINDINDIDYIKISVKEKENLQKVKDEIYSLATSSSKINKSSITILRERQKVLLENALNSLNDAIKLIKNEDMLDMIEVDILNSFNYLGEIIGDNVSVDIFEKIFKDFCIGK